MGKASRKKKRLTDKSFATEIGSRGSTKSGEIYIQQSLRKTARLPLIIIILFVSFAVYFNAVSNGFVYDDYFQVLKNPWIKNIKHVPDMFSKSVWSFLEEPGSTNFYRPLMHLIYMFNYFIFGLKPWGFHFVNILFHAGVSVLVFIISSKLIGEYSERFRTGPNGIYPEGGSDGNDKTVTKGLPEKMAEWSLFSPAFIAALLFATHPIHTEVVAWVAAVPDLSYTFFYLLSFYLYMKSEEGSKGTYLLSLLSFSIAALCKEPALTLPFILMAYDYCFTSRSAVDQGRSSLQSFFIKRYIPYFVIAGFYLGMRYYALRGFSVTPSIKLTVYGYIINTFPLFMQHLKALLLPLNLNAYHVLYPISSIIEPRGLLSLTGTAAFVIFIFIMLKQKNRLSFSLVMIILPLLPALYIRALGENVFAERYLYLPSFGFVLLIAWFLSWAKAVNSRLTLGLILICFIVTVFYSIGTIKRNVIWKDDLTLFEDTVKNSPDATTIHYDLGNTYVKQGDLDKAIHEFITALKLKPDHIKAHNNLGAAYLNQGRFPEAANEIMAALKLNPYYAEAHSNLGIAYLNQNRLSEAATEFMAALKLKPNLRKAHYNLGNVYGMQNRLDESINEFIAELKLEPDNPDAHFELGAAYMKQSRFDKAANEFISALKLRPGDAEARQNLEICYKKMKGAK